jgi:Na+/melibiose symporter-like transporter
VLCPSPYGKPFCRATRGYRDPVSAKTQDSERPLERGEKRLLATLGLPTLAFAFAITALTTYVPKLASQFTTSTTVIGVIVASEGLLAIAVPIVVGAWSDRLRTRFGGRLPFLVIGTPVMVAALLAVGGANSLAQIGGAVAVFFLGYFIAYEPYRALYPDLLEDEVAGRGQSTQAVWRGAGTASALVGGGLLFGLAKPAPFLAAAGVVAVGVAVFVLSARGRARERARKRGDNDGSSSPGEVARQLWGLLRKEPRLRAYLVANGLWELSLAALKTFVVLYITVGLGFSIFAAAAIVGGVALIVLVAAGLSGKAADRFGAPNVLRVALPVYGAGLLVPLFVTVPAAIGAALPLIAFGGGVIMALPYAMLIPLMPDGEHGALTGFYSVSRGAGVMLGPVLAGAAVSLLKAPLSSTHGYAAMWLVCAAAVLASIPLVGRVSGEGGSVHGVWRDIWHAGRARQQEISG